jgi:sugar lactone lactonase YvrE
MSLPQNWRKVGQGLERPESVQVSADGAIYCSARGHGACRIDADGAQTLLAPYTEIDGAPILPNGIALRGDGSILIANISDAGGIYQIRDGQISPYLTEISGVPLPPVNFVTVDAQDRVWFSISSILRPRHLAYRRDVANGQVWVIDDTGPRCVLEGLHYTNEVRPDLEGGWLYVAETFSQKITRFPLSKDLVAGMGETFAQFPRGAFVDGFVLDANGGLFAACIVSNEVFHVAADGTLHLIASERDAAWVDEVEAALDAGTMGRPHFDKTPSATLRNVSSVTFADATRTRLLCGALLADYLVEVPIDGCTR